MKLSELEPTNYDEVYKITDFEHFFNVVKDRRDNYAYNLNETIYFDVDEDSLPVYKTTYPMQWTLISHKIYQSTRLAWLLMKLNHIGPKDVFRTLPAGSEVKYFPTDSVQSILSEFM